MNLVYIRAAIQAATGVDLSLKEALQYLVEEGLCSKTQANAVIFPGYQGFYPKVKEPKEDKEQELTGYQQGRDYNNVR